MNHLISFTLDQFLYIIVGIFTPVIIGIFIKKRPHRRDTKENTQDNSQIKFLEYRIDIMEKKTVSNRIDIEEMRFELDYMKKEKNT